MLGAVGDLVEDIVVYLDSAIQVATDTPAFVTRRRGGSAANVAAMAARLGGAARFIGQVGDDEVGDRLVADLRTQGVDVCGRRAGRSGTVVVLVDERGERSMLSDRGSSSGLAHPQRQWIEDCAVLHFPLYSFVDGPLAATSHSLVQWAREADTFVSIDVSSVAAMRSLGGMRVVALIRSIRPRVVLANGDEAAFLVRHVALGQLGAELVIVKNGADPTVVHRKTGASSHVAVPPIEVVRDTTGAGDAFAAGFLTALASDDPVDHAIVRAHDAARIVISESSQRALWPADTVDRRQEEE